MLKIFIVIFALLLSANLIYSQDEKAEQISPEQKAWMDYMTPGAMHKLMAESVGEWKTVSKFWMDPNGEPMTAEGTATVEMILGGRYMKVVHKSTMMGMPTEGINLQAYDNATNEFISTWIDNLGTGIAVARGTYDETSNTLNFTGSMVDPIQKGNIDFRETIKLIDNNHQIFEMYVIQDGNEIKSMEVEFTR